jgi:hypothetical protein
MPKGDNLRGKRPEGAGRTKGVPNKVTLNLREKYGADMEKAIERVMNIAHTSNEEEVVVRAVATLMPYMYPKLSAVQVTQDKPQDTHVIAVRFVQPPPIEDGD